MSATATRDILLQTPHLQEATAFYRDTLGMRVFLSTPELVGIDAGAFQLYLELAPTLGPVLEMLVDDLPSARRQLLDEGCVILQENPAIPRLYLRDPFGLIFNLGAKLNAQISAEAEEVRGPEKPPHY